MTIGTKTGGRQKGTPNKRTEEIQAKLEQMGCDPLEGMARLAVDENNSPELRGRMYAELAQYVAPKRKAIEHSSDIGGTAFAEFLMSLNTQPKPKAEAEAQT
jgi:hypothetical protein